MEAIRPAEVLVVAGRVELVVLERATDVVVVLARAVVVEVRAAELEVFDDVLAAELEVVAGLVVELEVVAALVVELEVVATLVVVELEVVDTSLAGVVVVVVLEELAQLPQLPQFCHSWAATALAKRTVVAAEYFIMTVLLLQRQG